MIVGILKETQGENRVSLLPEQVETLIKKNIKYNTFITLLTFNNKN
jgi:alanine dehydrogenase